MIQFLREALCWHNPVLISTTVSVSRLERLGPTRGVDVDELLRLMSGGTTHLFQCSKCRRLTKIDMLGVPS